jgi:genome maintenance exonuclease 1
MKQFCYESNLPVIPKLQQVTDSATGKRHYVTPEGNRYPSVTTILQEYRKSELLEWRKRVGAKQADWIARQAANRGTRFHTLCERFLKNEEPFDQKTTLFDKALFNETKHLLYDIDNIHVQEERLFSNHLRLAGTVDCIAEHQGRLSVIDFKTSTRRKVKEDIDNYFMQCAAYAIMYEELCYIPVPKIVLIIACESEEPQLFVEKRDNYVKQLLYYRDLYEKTNPKYLDDVFASSSSANHT